MMGIAERRQRERANRQRLIQDAAIELFMKKGFFAVKMEDIAEKAELSIATIYLYFKSKDELYASLNTIFMQYLYDEVEKIYNNSMLSVEDKLREYRDALKKAYRANPIMLRVLFHLQLYDTLSTLDKKLLKELNQLGGRTLNMIAETYEEGIRQKKFAEGRGIIQADIIWAVFTGLVLWEEAKKAVDPNKNFFEQTFDRAFEIFFSGIQVAKPGLKRLKRIDGEGACQKGIGNSLVADG
jgi:AcrR family transcriptional regulator